MFRRLFGLKPSDSEERAALRSVQTGFAKILIQPSSEDIERGLESWSWAKLPPSVPLVVSGFGDMFFKSSGGIVMLDTLDGKLKPVCRSWCEFRERLKEDAAQDEFLSSVWIQSAWRREVYLEEGQCYDWKLAPVLGGAISADNVVKLTFVVKVNLAGQLHRQIKDLPPGTKINRVTISD